MSRSTIRLILVVFSAAMQSPICVAAVFTRNAKFGHARIISPSSPHSRTPLCHPSASPRVNYYSKASSPMAFVGGPTIIPLSLNTRHNNDVVSSTLNPSSPQSTRKSASSSSSLKMSLIPVPINELQSILAIRAPTGDQYVTYLGRTPRDRFNSLFEGASVAFLGTMFAYFISFVIGQFLATLLGTIFLFWPILSPEFKAYQRNWELCGGRDLVDVWMDDEDDWRGLPFDKRGLYGAYYATRIEDVCVVDDVLANADEEYDLEDFQSYSMEQDELESVTGIPWKLRLRLMDDEGRGMQVHCRLSEEYLDIQPGMNTVGVLLSTSREFVELAGMTDFCVLEAGPAWVGDYPYLDKDNFLRTLDENGVVDDLWEFEEREDEFDEDDDDFDGEQEEDAEELEYAR